MGEDKTLGEKLGEAMIDAARKAGIPVLEPVIIQLHYEDIREYLENLHRFEQASRKVNIRVGGDNCGYCRRAREMQRPMAQRAY